MERTNEDINEVLTCAKLDRSDLLPQCQTIYFSKDYSTTNDYKLLQFNPEISKSLKAGDVLYVKGDKEENAVICTESNTFEVLQAETSNSLLLIKDLKFSKDFAESEPPSSIKCNVDRIFFEYFEVLQKKPQLKKIKSLLAKSIYKGVEHEFEINQNDLFTFDELLEKVQASKVELKEILKELQIIEIDNKVRELDFEYHFRVLSYMLKLIDENSWALDEVNYEETMLALEELFPSDVLNCVFDLYTEESKVVDGVQLFNYKEVEVCKFFARVLLHSAGKFNLSEFLQAWAESVPEGMQTDEEMLYGIALIDRKSIPNVVWGFNESALSENIFERFKELFKVKDRWTLPEIAPYVKRLTTDKIDVTAILAKYARGFTSNGVRYFTSKHGK